MGERGVIEVYLFLLSLYIIKGYSATGVLFVGGLLLLIISAIMGHKVLPSSQAST
ncbi:hypothetical protein, partial [Escherichia coli]|uniref:hypothetical protein n=1 Tax=Escherichia coli TaxID=562 RepID=UPI001FCE9E17